MQLKWRIFRWWICLWGSFSRLVNFLLEISAQLKVEKRAFDEFASKINASTFLQNESIFNLVPLVALVWALCRRRRWRITSMLVCVLECVCVYWNVCVCVCVAMNVNLQWMIWQERVPRASDGSQVVDCDVATETTKLKTRVCRHASCEAELRHSSVSS